MDAVKRYNLLSLLTRSALWAICPDTLAVLVGTIATGKGFEFAQPWEASKPSVQGKGPNKVAVIPIEGVLTSDGPAWYGSNYKDIGDAVERAGADKSVKHVVLAVNSPGGEVTGLPETGALISALAKEKPVSAMVEGQAASAAYWLASQARDITLTPSGNVGSVGVRMMHMDVSKMLADYGVKVTEIFSGQHKTEWSPFKPLSQETIDHEQKELNVMHQRFIDAVSAGRGARASAEMKQNRFGEGRMFRAEDAIVGGLADKIQDPRAFYKSILPAQEQDAPGVPQFGFHARALVEVAKSKV